VIGKESSTLWSVPTLSHLNLLRATFVTYAFKRHFHDYFVIGLIEEGTQHFEYGRTRQLTPTGGVLVLNPGEVHTGKSATEQGFRYRAFYPSVEVMAQIASEISPRFHDIPLFPNPVLHDSLLFRALQHFHRGAEQPLSPLEIQSQYTAVLTHLITHHADPRLTLPPIGRERHEIRRLRAYLNENYAEPISLTTLAELVHWTPFYLLRVFRNEVGLPPHAYLETVRIERARQMVARGIPLAQIAYDTGFSSQSHFTTTFKRLVGVPPGQYAKEVNIVKDEKGREVVS
jgi:AraC-like DNA-binding protein